MIVKRNFPYKPTDSECEKASNAYVMSLVALIAGLPLPIVNLIATVIFYFANRKATLFVRWHCMQALLSQICVFFLNAGLLSWTIYNFKGNGFDYTYWLYFIFVLLFDLMEFIFTVYTAIQVRKGKHIAWVGFEAIADDMVQIK